MATVLPLQPGSGHLVANVMLNGQPVRMIIDTGATITVVSRTTADRLHLWAVPAGQAYGVGGTIAASLFYTQSFQIGTLRGKRFPLLVSDFNFPAGTEPADGLLGADFLSSYEMDFDLAHADLVFYRVLHGCGSGAGFLDGPLYHAALLPSGHRFDVRPLVAVRVNGRRFVALLDTGAPRTVMFRDAALLAGLRMDMQGARATTSARGVGQRAVPAALVTVPTVNIGEIAVHNMPVEIIDQYGSPDDADMILGLDLMMRLHVWISPATRDLIMQYPPRPSPLR